MKHSESVIPSGNEIAGIWKQQVGAAKILWGKLTDDEIKKMEELAKGATSGQAFSTEQLRDFALKLWHVDAQQRVERLIWIRTKRSSSIAGRGK